MDCPTSVTCSDIEAVSDLKQNPIQILIVDTRIIGQLRCGDKGKPLYVEQLGYGDISGLQPVVLRVTRKSNLNLRAVLKNRSERCRNVFWTSKRGTNNNKTLH